MTNLITAWLLAIAACEGTPNNPYGIQRAAIRDVNALTGSNYRTSDRRDEARAREIIVRYVYLHHPRKPMCPYTAARIVRGGPRGPQKRWTRDYGRRVENLTFANLGFP